MANNCYFCGMKTLDTDTSATPADTSTETPAAPADTTATPADPSATPPTPADTTAVPTDTPSAPTDAPSVPVGATAAVAAADAPLQIDLQAVLRGKMGRKARFVPRWLVRRLEKTICADALNELLRNNHPRRGADFCRGVFADLGVTIQAQGTENLPDPKHRRVVVVSNHPLGGLDGMALIAFFAERYGGRVHFLVNDLLMAVEPLSDVFVPINKHGAQSRDAKRRIDELFEGDDPILIFPAGLVSRLGKNGEVTDLEWKKMFVNRAIASRRDVIPVHFSGHNSQFFYKFARRRKRLGIKFNIEMIYLPRELVRQAGSTFTITCGKPIGWQQLKGGKEAGATATAIRSEVYRLARPTDTKAPTNH